MLPAYLNSRVLSVLVSEKLPLAGTVGAVHPLSMDVTVPEGHEAMYTASVAEAAADA